MKYTICENLCLRRAYTFLYFLILIICTYPLQIWLFKLKKIIRPDLAQFDFWAMMLFLHFCTNLFTPYHLSQLKPWHLINGNSLCIRFSFESHFLLSLSFLHCYLKSVFLTSEGMKTKQHFLCCVSLEGTFLVPRCPSYYNTAYTAALDVHTDWTLFPHCKNYLRKGFSFWMTHTAMNWVRNSNVRKPFEPDSEIDPTFEMARLHDRFLDSFYVFRQLTAKRK